MFCNVRKSGVIQNKTAQYLYQVPLELEKEGLAKEVCKHFKLEKSEPQNKEWEEMIENIKKAKKEIKVGIVGKYIKLEDAYISVIESLVHAGYNNQVKVKVELIDSEKITKENVKETLKDIKAVVVPGGFGNRGIEGMIETIRYVRENNIPFLGICLGMQMAVIEFAKNVLKLEDVNSEEFDKNCKNPVIHIMDSQIGIDKKGGTMRLGKYPCIIKKGTLAEKLYKKEKISERHRHRFEYNNKYREMMKEKGLIISGTSPDKALVEIVENPSNKFFIAGQFHPEFKSRPNRPTPLFDGLIKSILN